jgi:hypothetical protein
MAKKSGIKKGFDTTQKILIGLAVICGIGILLAGAGLLIHSLPEAVTKIGAEATNAPLKVSGIVGEIIDIFLGPDAVLNWEQLILHLMVFVILFFALSDIVTLFSTFSETTAWVIGFGLAVIAGVSGGIEIITGIFKFGATVGAVGIAIMVITAVVVAVLLNLGIGGPLKKWRQARQTEIEHFKTARGFGKLVDFVKGGKEVAEAAGEGESGK